MLTSSNRQLIVFSKQGDKYGVLDIPETFYLESEKEWVSKQLMRTSLDGIVFVLDWDKRQLTSIRHAK